MAYVLVRKLELLRNVKDLFTKYAPDEVDLAIKFIRGLGGDSAVGPVNSGP